MNQTLYIVTGYDDDMNDTILGIYPAENMAVERMDYLSKLASWGGIYMHEVEITPYGVDTEIAL